MRSFRIGFRKYGSLDIKSFNSVAQIHVHSSRVHIATNTSKTNVITTSNTLFPLRLNSRHFATQNHPVAPPKKKNKRPSNIAPIGVEEFVKEIQRLEKVQSDSQLTDEQKAEQIFNTIKRTFPFYDMHTEQKLRNSVLEIHLLLASGKLPEALKQTDEILSKNIPNLKMRVDLFIKKAQIHFTMQQYAQGLDASDEALKIDPMSFDARICRALCTVGLKKHEEALEQIESIIGELEVQVDPRRDHLATAYNAKGTILYAIGQPSSARFWMQKGLQYNPEGSLQHLMMRGVEFMERKQYQKALQIFEDDIKKLDNSPPEVSVPAKPKLMLLKAKALVKLERYKEALATLNEVEEMPQLFSTDRGFLVAEKSRALLGQGKPTESMHYVQQMLEAYPEIGQLLVDEEVITNLPTPGVKTSFPEPKKRIFARGNKPRATNDNVTTKPDAK